MAGVVPTLFFVAAGLLAWSGAGKVRRPESTAAALASMRLPGGRWAGRTLGLVEVALGLWCLVAPTAISAGLLGIAYGAFAAVVAVQLATGGAEASSCGCFGGDPTSPSWLHVGVDLTAATTALVAAIGPGVRGLGPTTVELGWAGPAYVAGLAAAVVLTSAVASSLQTAFFSYRGRREVRS